MIVEKKLSVKITISEFFKDTTDLLEDLKKAKF